MDLNAPVPIHIPVYWADNDTLTFEDSCRVLRVPQRTARDWRRRHVGPCWFRLEGTGRLYITVAELRRFLANTTTANGADR